MSDTHARPTFTVSGAADVTGKSRRTIGRMLTAGELVGAHKNDEGAWVIPLEALLGAGLRVNAPSPPDPPTPIALAPPAASSDSIELERVRSEAIEWRRRAEVAEAIATERAAALEDVRAALAIAQRMLPPIASSTAPDNAPDGGWFDYPPNNGIVFSPSHGIDEDRPVRAEPERRARWWRKAK